MGDIVEDMAKPNVDKIGLNDDRVQSCFATVSGQKWHYLDARVPQGTPQKGTIFLIHGFPDISLAWRYQIPSLLSLGFRCIALDCMGYGRTGTSPSLASFSFKTHADAVAGICSQLNVPRIVIGGHDWGGLAVYRVAQWYPELVSHVFSVCTSFAPCTDEFTSTEDLVKGPVPQFGYQLQFGSPDDKIESVVKDERSMRNFLLGMYGGRPKKGKWFMNAKEGVDLSVFEDGDVAMSPLLSEAELDFYVKEFARNGINGPCNWYRTRKVNWEDERDLPKDRRKTIKQPTLYILATKDGILTREMSRGMERSIPKLTRGEVPAGHWALWQTPAETNAIIKDWIEGVVLGGKSKL